MKNWSELSYQYALENAISHDGKALVNNVLNHLFREGLKKSEIKKAIDIIKKEVDKVNKLSREEQLKEFSNYRKKFDKLAEKKIKSMRKGLPEIPVRGKIKTRFSPSPSGPLHIGHILALLPNFLYVKKYGGEFFVRIEDTNPENIYKPAYKMIKEEVKWLCKNNAKIIIQSTHMNLYYKYAEKLIEKGKAYVCMCKQEKFKKLKLEMKACPCRSLKATKNLERWKKMLDKGKNGFKEGKAVLRFKSNINDKNPAIRDFPLARINLTSHALAGKKYRVWPLMNFSVSVDDMEMKITHMIRGKEHRDNAKKQEMIFKIFNKKYPWTAYIGRVHFKDLPISASKMRKGIQRGKYKSWQDERLPTIASFMKQGYKPETFWQLVEQMGIHENDKTLDKEEFFKLLEQFK